MLAVTWQLLIVQPQRIGERGQQPRGHAGGIAFGGQLRQQHDELVAAEARQQVARAQAAAQALRHFLQQAVAHVVARACR